MIQTIVGPLGPREGEEGRKSTRRGEKEWDKGRVRKPERRRVQADVGREYVGGREKRKRERKREKKRKGEKEGTLDQCRSREPSREAADLVPHLTQRHDRGVC